MWLADLQASINGKNNRRRIPDWTWLAAKETGSLPKIALESSVLIPAIPVICIQSNTDLVNFGVSIQYNWADSKLFVDTFYDSKILREWNFDRPNNLWDDLYASIFVASLSIKLALPKPTHADLVPEFYNAFDRPGRLQLLNGWQQGKDWRHSKVA